MQLFRKLSNLILFTCCISICSCNKQALQNEEAKPLNNINEGTSIHIPSNNIEWDESYHPDELIAHTRGKKQNYSNEMAVTINNLYIGGVYTANSINNLSFKELDKKLNPIKVSYTFARPFMDEIEEPSHTNMMESFNKAINSPKFSGKQSVSFSYDVREFKHYNELKLAFGADVNVSQIFQLNASHKEDKINKNNALFAKVEQKHFSIIMDTPKKGVFADPKDIEATANSLPVYINSITFGRKAIITIESKKSYSEIKSAFKAAFSAEKANGNLSLDAKSKKLLEEADIKIYVWDDDANNLAPQAKGFDKLNDFIIKGGEFTKEAPGVPIYFTAKYVKDYSVFQTSFIASGEE